MFLECPNTQTSLLLNTTLYRGTAHNDHVSYKGVSREKYNGKTGVKVVRCGVTERVTCDGDSASIKMKERHYRLS